MKYKCKDGFVMCDAWYLNDKERIHAFHLKLDENLAPAGAVGHVYTDDLLHFDMCDDILSVLDETLYPEDCLSKYTGCAVTGMDGVHYIYYTMRNKNKAQKIGLCLSEDLKDFKLYENNPVLVPDKNIFEYSDDKYADCRDMLVVYDDKSKRYYGYFAAMKKGNNVGVIGVAESVDLIHWENQSIVYEASGGGVIEVPDVYEIDGKWYLTYLTHDTFGMRGAFSDKNVTSGTLYAVADNPRGPFSEGEDNVFIGGNYNSGYTCRTFMYHGKRYLMYIDKSEYGWAISLPKEVKIKDGKLKPCYTEILSKMRVEKLDTTSFEPISSTVFWNVCCGEIKPSKEGFTILSNPRATNIFALDNVKETSLEIESYICSCEKESGFNLQTYDENGEKGTMFYILADFENKNLSIYEHLSYNLVTRRSFPFEKGKKYHFRIIAMEGQIEVYVDDMLLVQSGIATGSALGTGVISVGPAVFEGYTVYKLES